MTLTGALTTLNSFDGADGYGPLGTLIQTSDTTFYGATAYGGLSNSCSLGCGTVFKLGSMGSLTTVYSFCKQSSCSDGAYVNPLVQGTDGSFYGTTTEGGANNQGTVFKLSPTGALTTIYSFCSRTGCADGSDPVAGLVEAADGSFYGTTQEGGVNESCSNGCGTIFRITQTGTLKVLHSFCSQSNCADGGYPNGTLIQGTDGNFYGTAETGGTQNQGTIFQVTPDGTFATLYTLGSQSSDGSSPLAGLIQGTDGDFYGATTDGGVNNAGTIFRITPGGTFTTLYAFCSQSGCTDGRGPISAVIQDTNGIFYGTAHAGGASDACGSPGCGTVFSLSIGLHSFVAPQPVLGRVGSAIRILGTNLSGTTSVSFNGVPATFTIEVPTAIRAFVPLGATTGPVQVVTPSGTLTSNVSFQVLP
jgi:uncharacterized repeat protein (TIGR03803 family)